MTQRERVLRMLREAGDRGVTTNEFLDAHGVGSRFGARILELRRAGHDIRTAKVRQGQARYTLAPKAPDPPMPSWIEKTTTGYALRLFE